MDELLATGEARENWYYVIIQDPSSSTEQFVGFSDTQSDEKFIPVFKTKQQAVDCFALMPKDVFNGKYAVQAVIRDDLLAAAKVHGHKLYLLDERGAILDTIN